MPSVSGNENVNEMVDTYSDCQNRWLLLALLICYCTAAPISLFHHHRHSDNRTIKPAKKASTIPSIVKRITDTTTKSQALRRSTSSIRSSTGKAGLDRIAPGLDVLRVELVNLIRDLNNFEPVEDDVVAWTVLNHLNKMAIAHESLLDTLTTNYKLVKKLGWHSDTYRTLLALDDTWRDFFPSLSTALPNHTEHVAIVQAETRHLAKLLRTKDKKLVGQRISQETSDLSSHDIAQLYKQLMAPKLSQKDSNIQRLMSIRSSLVKQLKSEVSATPAIDSHLANKLRRIWLSKHNSATPARASSRVRSRDAVIHHVEEIDAINRQSKGIQLSQPQRNILLNRFSEAIEASGIGVDTPLDTHSSPILQVANEGEWHTIITSAAHDGDIEHIKQAIDLLGQSQQLTEDMYSDTLAILARNGALKQIAEVIDHAKHLIKPNEKAYGALVDAHTARSDLTNAWNMLSALESRGMIVPQTTYTNLIKRHLLTKQPARIKERGWNLFVHSRLMAHPTPSIHLYNAMITACAEGPEPEIERALDLYKEMKDYDLPLNETVYSSLIHTLAKGFRRGTAGEVDRLVTEMLDSGIEPTHLTFAALMELAKRTGDVSRARHVLASWMKSGYLLTAQNVARFFYAYAAARTPSLTRRQPLSEERQPESSDGVDIETGDYDAQSFTPESIPRFPHELIAESDMIFNRLLSDQDKLVVVDGLTIEQKESDTSASDSFNPFREVNIDTRLINSYISIRLNHSRNRPEEVIDFVKRLFTTLEVQQNGHTMFMLTEYIYKHHKEVSHLSDELFSEFREYVDTSIPTIMEQSKAVAQQQSSIEAGLAHKRKLEEDMGVDEKTISRLWSTHMNTLALSDRLSEAMQVLSDFVSRYPPTAVASEMRPLAESQPTAIKISKEIKPDLSPHLIFARLRPLHEKLVTLVKIEEEAGVSNKLHVHNNARQALGFFTWTLKAYDGVYRSFVNRQLKELDRMGPRFESSDTQLIE
ncbi:hypothetical protein E3P99_02239 [Wallemia hederae]|uniref:Pentatricopeptide repeat-containing protein-mitochondrial domain-containing protein n=1 Tax=Wallemia hederae TaxID=1540922 RepID=A0A4T0FQK6_9BASI|nr:hypothetical protein E3P99_02239 [Wallemia hederae]